MKEATTSAQTTHVKMAEPARPMEAALHVTAPMVLKAPCVKRQPGTTTVVETAVNVLRLPIVTAAASTKLGSALHSKALAVMRAARPCVT